MTSLFVKHSHSVVLIVAGLVLGGAVPLTAGPVARTVIRVYDMSHDAHLRRSIVLRAAQTAVNGAGIDAVWVDCGIPTAVVDSRRRGPRAANELIVRILHDGTVTGGEGRFALGYAVIEPATGGAALATVYTDAVQRVAHQAGADVNVVLGRAIAHEVGHLLLQSEDHSSSGLMREVWTDAELFRNRPEDWEFAPTERARLRQRPPVTAVATTESHSDTSFDETR
jgi:hypothetical protein